MLRLTAGGRLALFAGTAVLLVLIAGALWLGLAGARQNYQGVERTYQALNASEYLLSLVKDAETGERGYVLTGQDSFLEPYHSAVANLPEATRSLQSLIADNPAQRELVAEIDSLIHIRVGEFEEIVALRRAGNVERALAIISSGAGRKRMDILRAALRAVKEEDLRLLRIRTAEDQAADSRLRWLLLAGDGSLVAFLVFSFVFLKSDADVRSRIELDLRRQAALLDQAHDPIIAWTPDGAIRFWNQGAETLYGFTRDEAAGRMARSLLQTNSAPGLERVEAILMRDGHWEGELSHITRDGRSITVESRMTLVAEPGGRQIIMESNRDITARKQAERVLEESRERLQLAVEVAGLGAWETNLETGHIHASERMCRMFALEHDTHRDLWLNRIHPDDLHIAEALTREPGDPAHKAEGEYRLRLPDGSIRWVNARVSFVAADDGRPARSIGVIRDVTEYKLAEQILHDSRDQLRSILDHLPVAVIAMNHRGAGEYCNETGLSRFGLEPARVAGWTFLDAVHPDVLDSFASRWREALATGSQFVAEEQCRVASGEYRWMLIQALPQADSAGNIVRWFGTLIDIHDRKAADVALRKALSEAEDGQRLLDALMEHVPLGITIAADTPGVRGRRISRYGRELLGWEPGQPDVPLNRQQVFHPDGVTTVHVEELPLVRAMAAGTVLKDLEYLLVREDGERVPVLCSAAPILDREGQVTGGVAGWLDITDRKHAEQEVRRLNTELELRIRDRTAQLQGANKELEAFAYSVSHDLRAPLRGIDGWSLALLEDYGDKLDDRARQYLHRVRSESQRMALLIDDLLQISRLGREQMNVAPVDLSARARMIAARLRDSNPERTLDFVIEPGVTAAGDPRHLEIVLTNLLDNAVKFTRPRDVAHIEFGSMHRDGQQVYYVGDNGVGFDMAYVNTLFGAFQRLHKASEFPGTGIGLATVQRVIHRHGGEIWAEAVPDRGARFYFTLKVGE